MPGRPSRRPTRLAAGHRNLEEDPSHLRYLVTEPGMGYCFE
jgi:hypothetical protein